MEEEHHKEKDDLLCPESIAKLVSLQDVWYGGRELSCKWDSALYKGQDEKTQKASIWKMGQKWRGIIETYSLYKLALFLEGRS